MTRNTLICWFLTPILSFLLLSISAQNEPNKVFDYFVIHSTSNNFASKSLLSGGVVSLSSKNQYLIKEMCTIDLSAVANLKGNAVGLELSHFGYSKYGLLTLSSGYSRLFAKRIAFGLRVHFIMNHALQYPKKHSLTFDLSLYAKVSRKVGIGASVYNPANLKYGLVGKEKIPMLFELFVNYALNENIMLVAAVNKQLPGFIEVQGSLLFRKNIFGFVTNLSLKQIELNCSFWWKSFEFDLGVNYDYRLGFSPSIKLSYLFSTSKP